MAEAGALQLASSGLTGQSAPSPSDVSAAVKQLKKAATLYVSVAQRSVEKAIQATSAIPTGTPERAAADRALQELIDTLGDIIQKMDTINSAVTGL